MSIGELIHIFLGWRKASKCKKLIKRVQSRLKLLGNKRRVMVKQLREDIGQLWRNGHEQLAMSRIEQLYRDTSTLAVYDLLYQFCDFIMLNLTYIRRNKDCPSDIKEAVSSLIFASARCGDLPELSKIRKLFGECYGERFATSAVELLPGNLVNFQVKERLTSTLGPVSDDAKQRLLEEIMREYCCFFQNDADPCKKLQQEAAGINIAASSALEGSGITFTTRTSSWDKISCSKLIIPSSRFAELSLNSSPNSPYKYCKCKGGGYKDEDDDEDEDDDDVQEYYFWSPMNKDMMIQYQYWQQADQRVFVFKPPSVVLKSKKLCPKRTHNNQQGAGMIMDHSPRGLASRPPYSRAMTTPPADCDHRESSSSTCVDNNMARSKASSCPTPPPVQVLSKNIISTSPPSHVHPKLPDYDELAAKFKALKDAHRQAE
ncbi:hypothetical protein Dimus_019809 [Dionaea muscipula]